LEKLMDAKALLEQFLSAGRELAEQGQSYVEGKLDLPTEGKERDAALSSAGKGAAIAGVLALLLGTKTGRGVTGEGLKLGTLAALGSVAYKTYQDWAQKQGGQVEATASAPSPESLTGPAADQKSWVLLKAIIAAAKSDGHIDEAEKAKIEAMIGKLGLDSGTASLIKQEVAKPIDPKELAALSDSPATAAEIYLASVLIVNDENELEKNYLAQLAQHLNIPADLALQIKAQANSAS
jgi:uncharacterized membrane protein YebE (DUF533 family)